MPRNWRRPLIWTLKINLILLAIDVGLLPVISLLLKRSVVTLLTGGFFPMILLLDSGIVFLVGGLLPMFSSIFSSKIREHVLHSDEEWSQEKHTESQTKANQYIFLAVLLLVESIVSGFLT